MSFVRGPPLAFTIKVSEVPQGIIHSSETLIGWDGAGKIPLSIPWVVNSIVIESGSIIVNNKLPSPPDKGANAGFP